MGKGAAIGRADLARLWRMRVLAEPAATVCGYGLDERPEEALRFPDLPEDNASLPPPLPLPPPERPVFPKEQPRLTLLAAVRAEPLEVVAEEGPAARPITEEQLGVRWGQGPPLSPLIRWARLAPWLQRRLGLVIATGVPDLRRFVQRVASGLPVRRIPRRPRRVWAPRALLLWEVSQRFAPFQEDARRLHRRLLREGGRHWLRVVEVRGAPLPSALSPRSPDVPVLALSLLGQRSTDPESASDWGRLAKALRFRGQAFSALVPLGRDGWQDDLTRAWPMAEWDAVARLPRSGGAKRRERPLAAGEPVELLLDLLAPAGLVQRPLLRAVRRLLRAGVGVEALAWSHPDCTPQPDYFEFLAIPGYQDRLQRRQQLAARSEADRALVAAVDALIRAQQEHQNPLVRAETDLLLGRTSEETLATLAGVVDRLRDDLGRSSDERSGIGGWFTELFQRVPPAVLSREQVYLPLARIGALTKHLAGEKNVQWPAGLNVEEAVSESRRIEQSKGAVRDSVLSQSSGRLVLSSAFTGPTPLGFFRSRQRVHLLPAPGTTVAAASRWLREGKHPESLVQLAEPTPLSLISDVQRLEFAPLERPAWARRFWQDRFGLAAEFRVGEVPFVLRWIPPGQFRMGSPETELGRGEGEGPVHQVCISQGFWLGETPVTQAQWHAGALQQKMRRSNVLKLRPSDFEGPEGAPVESVSWYDCRSFIGLLSEIVGLQFSFPSEAQWEYACRAGTQATYYNGHIRTLEKGEDSDFAKLGWFDANSPDRTQSVKGKAPNSWGLFDMLGNVLEWCLDAGRRYDGRLQVDPLGRLDDPDVRVIRGGSWADSALHCRCGCRVLYHLGNRVRYVGFRLAASYEVKAAQLGDRQVGLGFEAPSAVSADGAKEGQI